MGDLEQEFNTIVAAQGVRFDFNGAVTPYKAKMGPDVSGIDFDKTPDATPDALVRPNI